MYMDRRQCAACGIKFNPRPQARQQNYCSAPACQRERRRQWQLAKLKCDPDYRDNQTRAQRAWRQRNPDYWSGYRDDNPEYLERNRTQQRQRNTQRRERRIAKMDASPAILPFPSGIYRISQASPAGIAKMDAWTVELTLLSET